MSFSDPTTSAPGSSLDKTSNDYMNMANYSMRSSMSPLFHEIASASVNADLPTDQASMPVGYGTLDLNGMSDFNSFILAAHTCASAYPSPGVAMIKSEGADPRSSFVPMSPITTPSPFGINDGYQTNFTFMGPTQPLENPPVALGSYSPTDGAIVDGPQQPTVTKAKKLTTPRKRSMDDISASSASTSHKDDKTAKDEDKGAQAGKESQSTDDSVDGKKPKRKRENRYANAPEDVVTKRRAQNRASQRAYRERKDMKIKELEFEVARQSFENHYLKNCLGQFGVHFPMSPIFGPTCQEFQKAMEERQKDIERLREQNNAEQGEHSAQPEQTEQATGMSGQQTLPTHPLSTPELNEEVTPMPQFFPTTVVVDGAATMPQLAEGLHDLCLPKPQMHMGIGQMMLGENFIQHPEDVDPSHPFLVQQHSFHRQ